MSHGPDGGAGHGASGGASFDHGSSSHEGGMHSLGHGISHSGYNHGNFGGIDHGFGFGQHGHAGSAMFAAVHGYGQASAHYGSHAVVMVWGMGLLSGGHVINTVSNLGPTSHDGGGHVDGPGANKQSPKDLRIGDIKGARLLVAHALGLKDHGAGYYGRLLDVVAKRVGLMRIDPRPNLKGEDSPGLDGILPWNAWGNPKSTTGPDGYEPLLRGYTDKYIHVYAIPLRNRKTRLMAVSPDEVVTVSVRLTVWHYAQTRDVEVKIEVIVSSNYVFDPFQDGRYTFYGRRTAAIEASALTLIQNLFADLTAPAERADHEPRARYVELVNKLPHMKGRPKVEPDTHPDGVRVGDEAEREELEREEVNDIRKEDREIENQVAGSITTAPPTVTSDDDSDLTAPNGTPGAVVAAPPVIPPAPKPSVAQGTFVIPIDLKK